MAENKKAAEKKKEARRESLQNIINAVAEKEDVITAFRGGKKSAGKITVAAPPPQGYGCRYLFWNFLGGLVFGFGFFIMLLAAAWFFSNFGGMRALAAYFSKAVQLLKTLGR
ncbi:MAG: hypothetical protein LBQ83_06255 [Candidatus Margulisbacteria bacterium]|jgi:hypothetical protein|nr:hypothetical protein [Candidatus Margulisiibacteriota bacterium]